MDGWMEGARGCVRGGGLVLGKKKHIFIFRSGGGNHLAL